VNLNLGPEHKRKLDKILARLARGGMPMSASGYVRALIDKSYEKLIGG
jgi:hypothetical protein